MELTIYPNAKINIGLNIVRRREDGYHDIETIFYPVRIWDQLKFVINPDQTTSRLSISGSEPMPICRRTTVDTAFWMLRDKFNIPLLDMQLSKHIPIGAGLGGGSADGAFTIKALNDLFVLGMTFKEMEEMAAQIGSDCAFFIENSPKYATGRGEVLTPVPMISGSYQIKVIKPKFNISTKEAYSMVKPQEPTSSLIDDYKRPVSEWRGVIKNDFEQFLFPKYPELQRYKDALYESGAIYASMTGSGSALFGIFDHEPVLNDEIKDLAVL
ncbi:MAG: 4-(cytidine 5'-diphospho)-2-C-methyl-D-erythritol kinase [Bacteroidales bacterium]|nr:4-(cytidine 5'-diphospho)-2-C-methyl-D-erythritol kinase [Bacteroidales bacterium]